MAKYAKNIEFTFLMPPTPLASDPDNEDTFPEIKVETGSLDMALQAILIRILSCLEMKSINGGAEYVFQKSG